jgi:hypothetical protein
VIAPRLTVRFRDRDFGITQLGEAWVMTVDGGQYFLTFNDPPDEAADKFLLDRLYSLSPEDYVKPGLVASQRHPLVFTIENRIVRAWPAFVPRSHPTWAKTYINPATGQRVRAMKEHIYWMFATRGRTPEACGTVSTEQRIADVLDLAQLWLKTPIADG